MAVCTHTWPPSPHSLRPVSSSARDKVAPPQAVLWPKPGCSLTPTVIERHTPQGKLVTSGSPPPAVTAPRLSAVGVQRETQASPGSPTRRLASQWSCVGTSCLLRDVYTCPGAAAAELVTRQ
uniref:Uncharacterized protein n=1 Tax=Rangifer tarandus platyrhynchus TaxID=3082113 RepID=A0ACB0FH89_RANTA|nr:unnamed protein product [Rangifer tarandus platyrhynchus]